MSCNLRTAKNENFGFSPSEIIFGCQIRSPLCQNWKFEHLCGKKYSKENIEMVQVIMKMMGMKAVGRRFGVGDDILLAIPMKKYPLSCRFGGPYAVRKEE